MICRPSFNCLFRLPFWGFLFGIGPLWAALPGAAEPAHGIAMHGVPKYPSGFVALDYVDPTAPKGGLLRLAVTGTFDSLNPSIVKGRPAAAPAGAHESLMARTQDEPFSLYGLIAESIETPADRAWVIFRLRPEARWQDGVPITVDDVLFSWRTLRDHGRPNHRAFYGKVTAAERLGDRGVKFSFAAGPGGVIDRELPLIMGLMPILPAHYWATRDFEATTLEPPLSSGPYRVAKVDPGRSITYQRVKDYWGRDLPIRRGQFNFDAIRYDYYRDEAIALEAFKAGEADFRVELDPARWASGYAGPALADGRIRLARFRHGRPEPARAFIFNTRRSLFRDPTVREALNYAFDFEWINRVLFHDAYRRVDSYYPNSELAATGLPAPAERALLEPFRAELPPELFTRPFALPRTDGSGPTGIRPNLRRAARLLGKAGWRVDEARLVDPAGTPFAFEILLNQPADEKIALEFARALARLGITARVRSVDSAQFQARLDSFDYDMVLFRWISTLSPGNEQVVFFGSAAADQPGSRNYPGIRSAAVDYLTNSLGQTTDRADLVARMHALDRVLSWGWYTVPLTYLPDDRIAYWRHLHHPQITPVYGVGLETWWID
ncbi:MAG: ABC transporter substrate-binding protein [Azospirillum sp.]|nr:ABC transporter substrate-binding protein [Azospirillum sp.]